jgi:hypothetical protein
VVEDLDEPGVRSHFAFVDRPERARTRPDSRARVVTRLKLRTQDSTDELLLVLARTTDERGRSWLRVRCPSAPTARRAGSPRRRSGRFSP